MKEIEEINITSIIEGNKRTTTVKSSVNKVKTIYLIELAKLQAFSCEQQDLKAIKARLEQANQP